MVRGHPQDLVDELKRYEERALSLASRLHAEVGLDADALNGAKQAMKFAGRARTSGVESRVRAARKRLLELIAFLEIELEQAELEVPDEVWSIPGGTDPATRRGRPPRPTRCRAPRSPICPPRLRSACRWTAG